MSTDTTAAATGQHDDHGHEGHHHILPLRVYFSVAGALFLATILTVWVAQFDFGSMNVVVAMAVAATKATLVALFFMHLKYDNKLYASFFVGSLVVLATFIVFTMFDTETRHRVNAETSSPINAHARIYGEDGKPLNMKSHGEGHGEDGAAHGDEGAAAGDHGEDAAASGDGSHGDEAAATDEQPAAAGTDGH